MKHFHVCSVIALTFPVLPFVSATTCERSIDPSTQNTPAAFHFASPDDLNWFSTHNCTTINGDITLLGSFNGSLSLPNVTSISGIITSATPTETWELTSITLPDVLFLGGININFSDIQGTMDVLAPKATAAGSINLAVPLTGTVDFRSLKQATSIWLAGDYSSVRFDSLEQVNGNLTMRGSVTKNANDITAYGQLPLSFPDLKSATFIQFSGAITEFSMPVLETANSQSNKYFGPSGLSIHNYNYGAPLDLDLPMLHSVGDVLDLEGQISGLSLESLQSTQANITVESSDFLHVNFTSLYSAGTIQLTGKIASAGFPSLTGVTRITINSTQRINCDSFQRAVQKAAPTSNSTCNGKGVTGANGRGLSTHAKAGIAVGVSIAGIIIVGLFVWYEQRAARNYKVRAGFYWRPQIPLQERTWRRSARQDDPPPPYSAHPPAA